MQDRLEKFYYQMTLIRQFEERLLELFSEGKLFGTTHGYIGQEANAVAAMNNLDKDDIVFSNHRCHGHYLAKTGDILGLMAELMGKVGGICAGRGGSQHLCRDNFYTNGVQGSIVPVAAGMALAEKFKKSGRIATVFIGDGTLGEGIVYETFNLISLWKIPLLVVIENNRYAQTTPNSLNFAGSFIDRPKAFGIEAHEIESNDVVELDRILNTAVNHVREKTEPFVQIIHTYRLCSHSKSDDFRDEKEIERWRAKDPLKLHAPKLDPEKINELDKKASKLIAEAEQKAEAMPFAQLDSKNERRLNIRRRNG